MKVSFEGIGEMLATFPAAGELKKGCVVKLDADGQASACDDGDGFAGVSANIRQGFAGVQIAGLAQVKCSGTLPGCGWVKLAADGAGGVKTAADGREYLVVAADAATQTAVIRL